MPPMLRLLLKAQTKRQNRIMVTHQRYLHVMQHQKKELFLWVTGMTC